MNLRPIIEEAAAALEADDVELAKEVLADALDGEVPAFDPKLAERRRFSRRFRRLAEKARARAAYIVLEDADELTFAYGGDAGVVMLLKPAVEYVAELIERERARQAEVAEQAGEGDDG